MVFYHPTSLQQHLVCMVSGELAALSAEGCPAVEPVLGAVLVTAASIIVTVGACTCTYSLKSTVVVHCHQPCVPENHLETKFQCISSSSSSGIVKEIKHGKSVFFGNVQLYINHSLPLALLALAMFFSLPTTCVRTHVTLCFCLRILGTPFYFIEGLKH